MQEPILFNKSITDNIKYGKLDATNEEVYKAALLANATGFIEAGQGDLTADEVKAQTEENLKTIFAEHAKNYSRMSELQEQCVDFSDRKQLLLYEMLSQGDTKILNLIDSNPGAAKELLDTYGDSPGMLWEELVIRFEWIFEIQVL